MLEESFFPEPDRLYKFIFWAYMDGFNREKDPIVMFMEHIGVPTKNIMKWNDIYWIFQTFLTNQKLKKLGVQNYCGKCVAKFKRAEYFRKALYIVKMLTRFKIMIFN